MEISIAALTMLLTIVWFVVFWLVAGVMFAVIALIRFVKLNKARFSCLFTILSFVTAYGAAWMGVMAAVKGSSRCLARIDALYEAIPAAGHFLGLLVVYFPSGARYRPDVLLAFGGSTPNRATPVISLTARLFCRTVPTLFPIPRA